MAIPGEGAAGSISGKMFFLIVIIIAVLVFLFARSNSIAPMLDTNAISSQASGLFSFDANALNNPNIPSNPFAPPQAPSASVSAFFCPQDACAQHLIQKIDGAQQSIYVAIYSFTHEGIADALIRAKERGVDVKVVLDHDEAAIDSSYDEVLAAAGIPIELRNGPGYMHNKFMVIDGSTVATGSFNYSQNADEKNDENLVFIEDVEVASKFKQDFDHLWEVSAKP